jgi:hypothetical protein
VDVVVQRWQTLSGEAARLDGEGRTFAEVAEVRRQEAAETAPETVQVSE